jgi:hypothetical protein
MVSTPELKKQDNSIISYEMKQSETEKLHILITSLFAGWN